VTNGFETPENMWLIC